LECLWRYFIRGWVPCWQHDLKLQFGRVEFGRVGVLADQFEQRENKELKMVDSGDAVPPVSQTNVNLQFDANNA